MPIPLTIPIILGALGGGSLVAWANQNDDEWADAAVFNARMRDIHMGILQLNDQLAKCKPIHNGENEATLTAWRNFVKSWSAFYGEVGTVWFAPSRQVIQEAKRKAATLAQWIENYRLVCGELPTGVMNLPADIINVEGNQNPNESPADDWKSILTKIGVGLVVTTAGFILLNNYTRQAKD